MRFRVTIQRSFIYSVQIEAEDRQAAFQIAANYDLKDTEADYSEDEVINVAESFALDSNGKRV